MTCMKLAKNGPKMHKRRWFMHGGIAVLYTIRTYDTSALYSASCFSNAM